MSGRLLYKCLVACYINIWSLKSGRLLHSASCFGTGSHRQEGDLTANRQYGGSLFPADYLVCL